MRRPFITPSPEIDRLAGDTPFRDVIAIRVHASADAIFEALRRVTLEEMKVAWLLGEIRYLPMRLLGRLPHDRVRTPFLETLYRSGTRVLLDRTPAELITGSAGRLHCLDQRPVRFASRQAFDRFAAPGYQKLFISVRVQPASDGDGGWLVLEHATCPLSADAARGFAHYWRLVRPLGAFVTRQLLHAVAARAAQSDGRHRSDRSFVAKEVAMARILVIYGTTDGQTGRIAAALGEALRVTGAAVDVIKASNRAPRPEGYDGVIVAASVHAGGYQRGVRRWVRMHADALATRPAAFVSVCLGVLQHDPNVDRELETIVERFETLTGWHPGVVKVVAGALPYTRYNWLKRRAMRRIVEKAGGDTDTSRDYEYTDWSDVRAFAVAFAGVVAETGAKVALNRQAV